MNLNDLTYAQAEKFADALEGLADKMQRHVEGVLRDAFEQAAGSMILGGDYGPGVPVDTGALRAGWRVGVGAPGGQSDVMAVVGAFKLGDELHLTNHLTYALPLDEGVWERNGKTGTFQRRTSEQQLKKLKGTKGPTHYVDPVLQQWPRIFDEAWDRAPDISDA